MIMNPSAPSLTPLRTMSSLTSAATATTDRQSESGGMRDATADRIVPSSSVPLTPEASPQPLPPANDSAADAGTDAQEPTRANGRLLYYTSRYHFNDTVSARPAHVDVVLPFAHDGGGDGDDMDDDISSTETAETAASATTSATEDAVPAAAGSSCAASSSRTATTLSTTASSTPASSTPSATAAATAVFNPRLPEDEASNNLFVKRILTDLEDCLGDPEACRLRTIERWNALALVRCHTQKRPDLALVCHRQALLLRQPHESVSLEASVTHHDMGFCYEKLHQNRLAVRSYRTAIRILDELDVPDSHPRRMAVQRSLSRVSRV